MNKQTQSPNDHQVSGYQRMLERAKEVIESTEAEYGPRVSAAVEQAKETATELGELTREEAERIGDYLKRDLHDAAEFIAEHQQGFVEWLRFDLQYLESRLGDVFATMIDHTREELDYLRARTAALGEWHTGEITGPGTLECKACGAELHFHKPGHIPPCPTCKGTHFQRSRQRS